jgi:shikimate 5-dehydrogenase
MGKLQQLNMILGVLPSIYPKTTKTLIIIGFIVVLRGVMRAIASLHSAISRRRVDFKRRYGRNSWALVTGSSDGIGKGIAFSLAKEGFNIILSARTESKLEGARNELKRLYPLQDFKILVVDYEKSSEPSHL